MARLCRCFMMNYVRSLCLRIWSVMAISLKFFKILLRAYLTWYRFKTISAQIENNSQFDYWWVYLNPSHKKREQSKMLKSPVVSLFLESQYIYTSFFSWCYLKFITTSAPLQSLIIGQSVTTHCFSVHSQNNPEITKNILPVITRQGTTGEINCTVARQGDYKVRFISTFANWRFRYFHYNHNSWCSGRVIKFHTFISA